MGQFSTFFENNFFWGQINFSNWNQGISQILSYSVITLLQMFKYFLSQKRNAVFPEFEFDDLFSNFRIRYNFTTRNMLLCSSVVAKLSALSSTIWNKFGLVPNNQHRILELSQPN